MTFAIDGLERRRTCMRVLLAAAAVACALLAGVPAAHAATFKPGSVISNETFRAYGSMSQSDIQAFLNTQKGPLAKLTAKNHKGKRKLASAIIHEACQRWHVNPRVMLALLQKEQSLLTRTKLVKGYKSTLDWAICMGCPDGKPRIEKYRGFGKQVWYGAWSFNAYGEAGKKRPSGYVEPGFKRGSKMSVGSPSGTVSLRVANVATYKLYTYNPSIGAKSPYGDLSTQHGTSGNAAWWKIYVRYFGDTRSDPAVKPVYRFADRSTGAYYYTASDTERYTIMARASRKWSYQGYAFGWNTAKKGTATRPANDTPVYRLHNKDTGIYVYTSSARRVRRLTTGESGKVWRNQGVAWKVASKTSGARTVYMVLHVKSGTYLYTLSRSQRDGLLGSAYSGRFTDAGSFKLGI